MYFKRFRLSDLHMMMFIITTPCMESSIQLLSEYVGCPFPPVVDRYNLMVDWALNIKSLPSGVFSLKIEVDSVAQPCIAMLLSEYVDISHFYGGHSSVVRMLEL